MTRSLLIRGMVVGLVAGLLVFLCGRLLGEPEMDRALAFEAATQSTRGESPEEAVVGRKVQKSIGLLTATVSFGAALGGGFGLVFAACYGRVGPRRPRTMAACLAGAGFVVLSLVPGLKYAADPPAVGNPETVGVRTAAFFLMIAFSLAAGVLSIQVGRRLVRRYGLWNGSLLAILVYVVLVGIVGRLLPAMSETPAGFPADLLWRFRVVALAMQGVLWAGIGLLFGWLTERDAASLHATQWGKEV